MKRIRFGAREVVPSKIICVGRNYVEHIKELGNDLPEEMVVFLKPNSAIADDLKAGEYEPVHYEAEICFLVEAGQLAGVGCGLDLTRRELQTRLKSKGLPWERAKAFDGAALFGQFVKLPSDAEQFEVELQVNGELRQQGSTAMMIHSPKAIVAELNSFMTLEDGDIIMTGTPAGVGPVLAGDLFTCRICCGGVVLTEATWRAVSS